MVCNLITFPHIYFNLDPLNEIAAKHWKSDPKGAAAEGFSFLPSPFHSFFVVSKTINSSSRKIIIFIPSILPHSHPSLYNICVLRDQMETPPITKTKQNDT